MESFGDPGFHYHRTLATILALLTLELSDRELLPFDFKVYASAVKGYVGDLEGYAKSKGSEKQGFDLNALHQAADVFAKNAEEFHEWSKAWEEAIGSGGLESNVMAIKRMVRASESLPQSLLLLRPKICFESVYYGCFRDNAFQIHHGHSRSRKLTLMRCAVSQLENVQF